jgi:uncharacterized protein (DUF849 family)
MLLKAAINGRRTAAEHPGIPITPSQQADQAAMAVAAGAGAIHVHPRDSMGRESLACADIAATLEAIRAACPATPIGVSTGAWIAPEVDRRLALIDQWKLLPDFAGVNFHEPGASQICRLLLEKGVGVEAGIWNTEAAYLFQRSGLPSRCLRILIEPAQESGDARKRLEEIETVLHDVPSPRLLHGFGASTWEFIALAQGRGYDTRIGFEDTLALPDGSRAEHNGELVAAARQLIMELYETNAFEEK